MTPAVQRGRFFILTGIAVLGSVWFENEIKQNEES